MVWKVSTLALAALSGSLALSSPKALNLDHCHAGNAFEDGSYTIVCVDPAFAPEGLDLPEHFGGIEPDPNLGFWEQLDIIRETEGAEHA